MSKLADTLVAARRMRAVPLAEVEEATRIKAIYLRALEADRFDLLPPPVYTRGFVANYADYLGLDRHQMTRLYDEAIGHRSEPVKLTAPETVRIGGLMTPNVAAIGIAVILAASLFAWLYSAFFVTGPNRTARLPTPVIPTPTALAATSLPTPSPTPETTSTVAATPVVVPTPTLVIAPATTPPATGMATTPAAGTPASSTPTPAATPLSLKIKIIEAPSWVQIRTDGVVVFSGTLAPGAERAFNATSELFIHAGRSDAVEIILNGVSQGRLGRSGQAVVRRTFTRPGTTPPATVSQTGGHAVSVGRAMSGAGT
jgi:cytoskeletal protein RodZ